MKTASTLGITWDEEEGTYDAGAGDRPMADVDLEQLYFDVVAWRERPIEGDREAEEDWRRFAADVELWDVS